MNLDVVLKHHIGIQRWSEKSTGGNSADFANSVNSPLRRQVKSHANGEQVAEKATLRIRTGDSNISLCLF